MQLWVVEIWYMARVMGKQFGRAGSKTSMDLFVFSFGVVGVYLGYGMFSGTAHGYKIPLLRVTFVPRLKRLCTSRSR